MNPNVDMAVMAGMAEDHRNQMMREMTTARQMERMRAEIALNKLSDSPVPALKFKLSYALAVALLLLMMIVQVVVAAVNAGGGGGGNLVR